MPFIMLAYCHCMLHVKRGRQYGSVCSAGHSRCLFTAGFPGLQLQSKSAKRLRRLQAGVAAHVSVLCRWAMLVHVTRIISEFVVLIAILVKLFSDTRIGAAPGIATPPTEALMSPPPPSPPPPPPPANTSVPHAGVSVPMLLISLAFSIATGVLSILATGSMVQLMGIPVSATSSGTSVWSRMQRSSHGTDAPRSLVPRRGFPVALGGANRVAPES